VHGAVVDEEVVERLCASTRAYTRVVLRLRAQAEAEAGAGVGSSRKGVGNASGNENGVGSASASNIAPGNGTGTGPSSIRPASAGGASRQGMWSSPPLSWNNPHNQHHHQQNGGYGYGSRGVSPAGSVYSRGSMNASVGRAPPPSSAVSVVGSVSVGSFGVALGTSGTINGGGSGGGGVGIGSGFRSPLFRIGRAPLLRVFVPSLEGDWLSDASVLLCEAELRQAGVVGLMRAGDVVWDIAAGDEGNVGRMVWDGSYLIVSASFLGWSLSGADLVWCVGSGLYIFDGGRSAQVRPWAGVLAVVLPQSDPDGDHEWKPDCACGYQSVGRGNRNESAAIAGSDTD
jgi:hypothetical protein